MCIPWEMKGYVACLLLVALVLAGCPAHNGRPPVPSTTQKTPRSPAPKKEPAAVPMPPGGPAFVYVSTHKILVQGKLACRVTAASKTQGANWRIPPLMTALQDHELPDDDKGEILICANGRADFAVIKKVIFTGGLAGYKHVSLGLVKGTPAAAGVRPSHCAPPIPLSTKSYAKLKDQSPSQRLKIVVLLDDDGHLIVAGPQRLKVPRINKMLDLKKLGQILDGMRKRLPDKKDLTVAAADGTTFLEDLDTLLTAWGSGFVYLSLSDAGAAL